MTAEWSDWYTKEDVTGWVLPRILRERAEEHPDRPYIRFGDGDWTTYGEIDAEKKHENSHRADAFAKLVKGCFA